MERNIQVRIASASASPKSLSPVLQTTEHAAVRVPRSSLGSLKAGMCCVDTQKEAGVSLA